MNLKSLVARIVEIPGYDTQSAIFHKELNVNLQEIKFREVQDPSFITRVDHVLVDGKRVNLDRVEEVNLDRVEEVSHTLSIRFREGNLRYPLTDTEVLDKIQNLVETPNDLSGSIIRMALVQALLGLREDKP